jgi:ribosome-binding protein aMBF1 (putative translation factor)
METGHFEPPIEIARKMEKILHVALVEMSQESSVIQQKKEERPEGMTIGDILKLKDQ